MIIKRIDNTGCLVAIYEIENIFHVTSSFNSPKSKNVKNKWSRVERLNNIPKKRTKKLPD